MSTVLNRLIKKLDKRANKNSVKCHLFRKKERTDKEPSSTPVPKSAPPWAVEADGEQMSPLSTTPCRQSVTPTARSHSVTPTAQSHSVTPTARSHSVTPTAQSHSVTPTAGSSQFVIPTSSRSSRSHSRSEPDSNNFN